MVFSDLIGKWKFTSTTCSSEAYIDKIASKTAFDQLQKYRIRLNQEKWCIRGHIGNIPGLPGNPEANRSQSGPDLVRLEASDSYAAI
jgi:hypothetical protein